MSEPETSPAPDNVTREAFRQWSARFFQSSTIGNKLCFVGPKMYWFLTGRFRPENWIKGPGNAHQRRKLKRWQARMWKIIGAIDIPTA